MLTSKSRRLLARYFRARHNQGLTVLPMPLLLTAKLVAVFSGKLASVNTGRSACTTMMSTLISSPVLALNPLLEAVTKAKVKAKARRREDALRNVPIRLTESHRLHRAEPVHPEKKAFLRVINGARRENAINLLILVSIGTVPFATSGKEISATKGTNASLRIVTS